MGHWFVKNAAVNPLYQRSDVYPQHVHHVLSSVDFITQQSKSGNNKARSTTGSAMHPTLC